MVRATQVLCKYVPEWYNLSKTSSSYFKKQAMIYMCRFHKGISWSQFKNATNRFEYYLKGEMYYAAQKRAHRRDINRARIAAACEEHGYKYKYLMSTLPKADIHLNLAALARLSIYEPHTFKALVDISREIGGDTDQPLEPANFNPARLDSNEDVAREFQSRESSL